MFFYIGDGFVIEIDEFMCLFKFYLFDENFVFYVYVVE